jgi:tyrosyl-tRNA synthetase
MSLEEKMQLIKRNSVELITEPEVRELLRKGKNLVTYCGYEPSGEVHLGHMVTATKLVDLEKAGFLVKVLLADWHAWLNRKGSWEFIHETADLWKKAFKKMGLKNAKYVLGSSFQRKPEYIEDVLTLSLHATIKRAQRAMQEIVRGKEEVRVSQMVYPLMQLADIKHLKVTLTEAGLEQRKIHMLGREIMKEIGYGKPLFVHTPLIDSLLGPGKKMSSSEPNSMISVKDKEEEIRKKVLRAYCPEAQTEGNALLQISQLIIFPRVKSFEVKRQQKFGGPIEFISFKELKEAFTEKKLHPLDLKNAVADYLIEILKPIREVFA